MESPLSDRKRPPRSFRRPLRSRSVNNVTCAAGLVTAGIGILGVLTRAGGPIDMVLVLVGLLVTLVGLVLRGRSPRN
jgi:hypothetical protein